MKKKIVNVLLIVIFMFSFVGCGLNKVEIPELNVPESSDVASDSTNADSDKSNVEENSSGEGESEKESVDNSTEDKSPAKETSNSKNKKTSSKKNSTSNSKSNDESKKSSDDNTCTITIRCDTAINTGVNKKPEFSHLPSDGVILPVTTMKIKKGDTVYDILQRIVKSKKIHMEYNGVATTIYIQGIDNLYEFDGGRWSGWMYCVNDWYPNYGCGSYKVKPGDVIQWNYTCDLGEDLGQHWLGEDIREKEK
ncbi:DUF4430 domain-containing protein [Clostridium frigidicarnis]|uniref:Transcobalamin-like C-terminal domain-containing protein n=1 Tax=Clostridium frigidicarnis TaxID=84698 RepID=A0A1I0XHD8_9CLOT|nr:DUF4430 domain-containing protein [Clostridium frigidicarnis]SFB00334.1 protein of unknown function [Clostridium frigidicarnis]